MSTNHRERIRLFALQASRDYGQKVSRALGVPLSPHEEREFEDGEHKARPLCNVRGTDAFVVHSLYSDSAQSVNDKLCRLLFFLGALKDAGAQRVTAVIPYLGYARKDRRTKPRDPVTTRYVAQLFEAVGVDRVLTMDVHNLAAFQNAFRCPTDHLEAKNLFVAHLKDELRGEAVAVVSPDPGGVKRAEDFGATLGQALGQPVPLAFMEKKRSEGVVSGEQMVGDLRGRNAVIVDDLVSSGTTLVRSAKACRSLGAHRVQACATHGIFVGAANDILAEPVLEQIIVTDTLPPFRLDPGLAAQKVTVLESAGLVAEAIARIHSGGSVVELLEYHLSSCT
ncbi:MAG: ribose-phosphate diphosphokinase [Gammaproteobacteria bacterium]|nr:ribose-phosphate diphosphokinase [Gammaproteobacteria bacterium]